MSALLKLRILLLTALVSLAMTPATAASKDLAAGRKLMLLCSAHEDWCLFVADTFGRAHAVSVELIHRSSGDALKMLADPNTASKVDVWYGGTGDPHLQAAEQRLTQPYQAVSFDRLHPWAHAQRAGWRTVGIYSGVLGFAYNAGHLARLGRAPPRCWRDLLDPAWEGRIVLPSPVSSGTRHTKLATLVQLKGEEAAFAYLRRLDREVAAYTTSGSAPLRAVSRDEPTVSVSPLHDVVSTRLSGVPTLQQAPCEGTGIEIGSMSIALQAPHLSAARDFYE